MAPRWLSAMQAWYSGILPYPLLLPIQIALLMWMGVLAIRTRAPRRRRGVANRTAKIFRILALLYVAGMAVRVILNLRLYGRDYYLHGAIRLRFIGFWRCLSWFGHG